MVFANLDAEDKTAFFELLDEYFSTRPELAETLQLGVGSHGQTTSAAAGSATSNQNALKKSIPPPPSSRPLSASSPPLPSSSSPRPPARPPTVPRGVSAVLGAALDDANSKVDSPKMARTSPSPSNYNNNNSNDLSNELSSAVGRIAAAKLALNSNTPNSRPTPPPRRVSSTSSDVSAVSSGRIPSRNSLAVSAGFSLPQRKTQEASNKKLDARPSWIKSNNNNDDENEEAEAPALVTPSSLRASRQNSSANPNPAPASTYAPPPRRAAPPPRRFKPEPEPEPEPEEEQQQEEEEEEEKEGVEGEWAEVLYDYTSSDPNDLELKAEERVLVKEHTSDDWWTAELHGKTGLIPAAYVKAL